MEDLLIEDCFEDIFLESALLEPEIDSVCSSVEPHAEGPLRSEQSSKVVENKTQSSSQAGSSSGKSKKSQHTLNKKERERVVQSLQSVHVNRSLL